ncbi:MAG: 50S ribosomal protein L6 [Candidatus Latescibacterota bacterium]|nr:50S ribosomal protein L6 [Candidatus Latescibacterota bacterium]MEE2627155.1 50S ribosomal protein L6 [Candidatus Latescibacterota bacterium]MEE2726347.1 50S ribosomal protein L6 [Candidatus Latescibacterota bacterium]
MSRIGKTPIALPQGVDVKVEGPHVAVKGPKGALTVPFVDDYIAVNLEGDTVQVTCDSQEKSARSLHGLTRTLIANAVAGVTEGFSKNLDLFGVGWRAEAQGSKLTLHVGYSHPVVYDAPEGINIQVGNGESGSQARITVSGIDKQVVGQVAADIRFKRKPEPYKGKGIRYENEVIHWKQGKTAAG